MGRLTLNVLLSFAQFEREVTGERIRDKIAASKRKGMWMGGNPPLGYDRGAGKLIINTQEAEQVRRIFDLYLELACVRKLRDRLVELDVRSKAHVSQAGRKFGRVHYSRGALYNLLKNPIYIAEIRHREHQYPGQHEAIVPRDLWDKVQTQLRSSHQGRRSGVEVSAPSLLAGWLWDEHGRRFTPSHTLKNGKRYHYYFCPALTNSHHREQERAAIRLPARDIEVLVLRKLQSFLSAPTEVMDQIALLMKIPSCVLFSPCLFRS